MLFTLFGSVRTVNNCDFGLENAALQAKSSFFSPYLSKAISVTAEFRTLCNILSSRLHKIYLQHRNIAKRVVRTLLNSLVRFSFKNFRITAITVT